MFHILNLILTIPKFFYEFFELIVISMILKKRIVIDWQRFRQPSFSIHILSERKNSESVINKDAVILPPVNWKNTFYLLQLFQRGVTWQEFVILLFLFIMIVFFFSLFEVAPFFFPWVSIDCLIFWIFDDVDEKWFRTKIWFFFTFVT